MAEAGVKVGKATWRHGRPFWGGLFVLLGGLEMMFTVWAPLGVVLRVGMQNFIGYLIPIVIILCGLLLWFTPAQRVFYSLVAIVCGLASFLTSNMGGFIIGLLLTLTGGALAFAWATVDSPHRALKNRRRNSGAAEIPQVSRRQAIGVAGGVVAGAAIAQAGALPAFGAAAAADADAIVVGHGLAGLVATAELVAAGRKVLLLDQENEANLGGQAHWSFGGLFFVNSDEQRLMGVKDTYDLAWQDWLGTAGFDRGVDDPAGQDYWAYKWAQAYVQFAAGEKRSWLAGLGMQWFPMVGWAERGGGLADGHGNSVPRFHVTWGTGPAIVEPFEKKVRAGVAAGKVVFKFRHRVDEIVTTNGAVTGVRGKILEASTAARGKPSSRTVTGDFDLKAPIVIVASGGIGANHDLIRQNWPARLGKAPTSLITGVPAHVDGRMLAITANAGGRIVNPDRMWHYTEGLRNWDPIWPNHGIRILPGPSSMWLDATGKRFQAPDWPGYDTLHTLGSITASGYDYSWFVTTQKIVDKEFALSGSEQNPDLTNKNIWLLLSRVWQTPEPIQKFQQYGADFVKATTLPELVAGMNRVAGSNLINLESLKRQIEARDREIDNSYSKDAQVQGIRNALSYPGDVLGRTASAHKLLGTDAEALVAVKLNILTRKTLGGLQTNLQGQVLNASGNPVPGLYAAGEAAGFGGGGVHGYRSLEGTFLGGCLFSGRAAGRAAAAATAG